MIHDDGTSFSVRIPALLVTESTGKLIRDALLLNNNKVVLKAKFETSTKASRDKVMYTLYYGSILDLDK